MKLPSLRSEPRPSRLRPLVPIAYCAALYILSAVPGSVDQQNNLEHALWGLLSPLVQNFLHLPLFAGLAWSCSWALRGWDLSPAQRLSVALVLTLSYGAIDEWHQSYVPGRSASQTDFFLNALGAALGALLPFAADIRIRN